MITAVMVFNRNSIFSRSRSVFDMDLGFCAALVWVKFSSLVRTSREWENFVDTYLCFAFFSLLFFQFLQECRNDVESLHLFLISGPCREMYQAHC